MSDDQPKRRASGGVVRWSYHIMVGETTKAELVTLKDGDITLGQWRVGDNGDVDVQPAPRLLLPAWTVTGEEGGNV